MVVKLYTDDGGIRPVDILVVAKLHKCAPANTLCQSPRVHTDELFLAIVTFPKGKHLQIIHAQCH